MTIAEKSELHNVFVASNDEEKRLRYYGLHCGKFTKEDLQSKGESLAKKLFSNKEIASGSFLVVLINLKGRTVAGIKEDLSLFQDHTLAFLLAQEKKLTITVTSSIQVVVMYKKEFQIATTTESFATFEIDSQNVPEFIIFGNNEFWQKSSKDIVLQMCRDQHKTIDAAVDALLKYAKTLQLSEGVAVAILSFVPWSKRLEATTFRIPEKMIHGAPEFLKWQKSKAYQLLLSFILALQEETKSKANNSDCQVSKTVESILSSLETLNVLVDEVPPTDTTSRYGNKSYRVWSSRMEETAPQLMKAILLSTSLDLHKALAENEDCCKELAIQFSSCFGNNTRIDYGSGHEASFLWWLCHLHVLKVLSKPDFTALVTKVFSRYDLFFQLT